jgi:hypothetical protein
MTNGATGPGLVFSRRALDTHILPYFDCHVENAASKTPCQPHNSETPMPA